MNMKRMRGRNHRPNGGGGGGGGGGFRNQQNGIPLNRNHVFDSSGPEMRLRGTAQQLHEKYTQLARDASSSGDRVTGEAYYQHAEHYFRIISAINQAAGQTGQPVPQPHNGNQNPGYQNNGQGDYQNRRPYNQNGNQPNGNGQNGNGNAYQDPQDQADPRAYEPRQEEARPQQRHEPRQEQPYQDRRPERQRPFPRPVEAPQDHAVDRRIDISLALEAELAAAAQPGLGEQPNLSMGEKLNLNLGEQPNLNLGEQPSFKTAPPARAEAAPEPRAIPISATPPEDAPPIRPRAPRGRPRTVKPEAVQE